MIHDLKIAPEWFKAVQAGVKTFEVRRDDRDFKPNDILILREFDGEKYTGQQEKIRNSITGGYIHLTLFRILEFPTRPQALAYMNRVGLNKDIYFTEAVIE